jgi:hypothetical protein
LAQEIAFHRGLECVGDVYRVASVPIVQGNRYLDQRYVKLLELTVVIWKACRNQRKSEGSIEVSIQVRSILVSMITTAMLYSIGSYILFQRCCVAVAEYGCVKVGHLPGDMGLTNSSRVQNRYHHRSPRNSPAIELISSFIIGNVLIYRVTCRIIASKRWIGARGYFIWLGSGNKPSRRLLVRYWFSACIIVDIRRNCGRVGRRRGGGRRRHDNSSTG